MPPDEEPYLARGNVRPYPRSEVARRLLWSLVQASVFRWSPRPLHRFRVWLLALFGARLIQPSTIRIYPTAQVTFPWKLTVHPHAMIGPHVHLYNLAPVTLGRGTLLSQYCHLCAGTHDYSLWSMPLVAKPIELGANVWLGADVFVGPGVRIGDLCVVGARSVVVKDQPERMVCAGHPCQPLKPRGTPR